ncbi:hypothetical protein ACS0TY_009168 [Phlomoides rotata]
MSQFREMEMEMEWNWETFAGYGSKAIESPKKMQLTADWVVADDGSFNFNLSGNGGGNSSAKSSISASTDSGMRTPNYTIEGSCGKKTKISITSQPPPDSSAEALLGLKLGKRTYFENGGGGGGGGGGGSVKMPTPSTIIIKKTKSSSGQNASPPVSVCCQVEGCNIELSKAKEYHRKHRVCDTHSKSPRVIVGGRERRFCQQCSRFHNLSEFDEKKRSCRRRLSDHNARRRKPQQETIHFDPTRHSTPYYGGNQQMSFLLNSSPLVHSTTPGNRAWDSACNSKFTLTQGYSFNTTRDGGTTDHMPGTKPPQGIINMQNSANGLLLPSKDPTSLVSNPAAPEFGRALSLLSTNSWDSCQPESIPLHHHMHETDSGIMQHAIPQGDFWLSPHPHTPTNNSFQEIQLLKAPYDDDNFYSNILN